MTKYLKPGVFILSLFPFLIITYKIFFNKLGPEPVKEITHFTGEWTLIFICLTLSMSPLKKLTKLSLWINFRRMLGLFVFFYATLHLLTANHQNQMPENRRLPLSPHLPELSIVGQLEVVTSGKSARHQSP